jgi:hypothetical protein
VLVGYFSNGVPARDIAVANRTLFVALSNPQRPGIHRIPRGQINASYDGAAFVPGVVPRSLAADATSIYYIDGTNLVRVALLASGPAPPEPKGTVAASSDRLVVDAECIYWVEESGARIMRRSK